MSTKGVKMYTIRLVYSSVSILIPGALGFCKNMDLKLYSDHIQKDNEIHHQYNFYYSTYNVH